MPMLAQYLRPATFAVIAIQTCCVFNAADAEPASSTAANTAVEHFYAGRTST